MAIPSFSAFHDEGINLEGLLEILSPENNLVLADDMMVSDGNGIILRVSETYEKNFGFAHDSIVGKSAFDLEADGTFTPCITAEVIRRRKKISATQTINHTHKNVMTVGIPLFDANGELKYAVCFNTVSMEQINSIQRNYRRMQDSLQHYSQEIAELRTRATSTNLLFKSAPMQRLWTLMQNTANTRANILITGETGAGKSIILGAIGLLLGQRADIKAIKKGANKCIVEARFNISAYQMEPFFTQRDLEYDPDECIIRRELYASGKSRAFINDTPASLAQMKELGEKLIDVHSQHQNLLLNSEGFQLNVLDILAQDDNELSAYKDIYTEYRNVCKQLADFITQAEQSRKDEDYIRFQLEQLDDANLQEGEQTELEQEAETLNHAEEIKAGLYKVDQIMASEDASLLSATKECMQTLHNIARVYTRAQEWIGRLDSCYIELKDLSHEIAGAQEEVEFNPTRLDYVNERLNLIYSLQQKHHVQTIEELIAVQTDYHEKLNAITSFDDRIAELTAQKETLYDKVIKQAAVLTKLRSQSGKHIERQMQSLLVPLGMPNVRFVVELNPRKEPDSKGMDSVTFLFSANKNGTLQNVASVASGGEIARVMLSLKAMIAGAVKLPTIIFDEIDTGVSGSIAEKMALIMQEMGKQNRQVISITHLPQIAARGITHYKVYKEDTETGTNSHIRRLTDEERVKEIANMLSGATLTEAALNNAKALISG